MGAEFQTAVFSGNLTREELRAKYEDLQASAASEHGCSYSGSWNMCRGLKIHNEVIYGSQVDAERYLDKVCEKWGDAVAVKFADRQMPALTRLSRASDGRVGLVMVGGSFYALYVFPPSDGGLSANSDTFFEVIDGLKVDDVRELKAAAVEKYRADRPIPEEDELSYLLHRLRDLEADLSSEDQERLSPAKLLALREKVRDARRRRVAADRRLVERERLIRDTYAGRPEMWMIGGLCAS